MDTLKGTYEDLSLASVNLIFPLTVMGATIVIMCCWCYYFLRAIAEKSSYSDDMDRRETPGIELRQSNYEETLKIDRFRHQPELPSLEAFNIASNVNNDIGTESNSGVATTDSIIGDNDYEEVIYNACIAGDHSGNTFRIEKNSDLQCSSRDVKGTSDSNTVNVIKSSEYYVENVTLP